MQEPQAAPTDQSLLVAVAESALRAQAAAQAEVAASARDENGKQEFLAILAHELRNPLAALQNAVQLARHPRANPATQERALLIIERQARELAGVVDDLIDASRVVRGGTSLAGQSADVVTALKRALDCLRPEFAARRQDLRVELPAEPVFVEGDPARLEQAFSKLLINAEEFTHDQGEICVSVAQRDAGVEIRFRDNGMGIAPEVLPRVFELFALVEQLPESSKSGLGIGLAVAKKIVEQHGGTVEAASGGLALGSEFVVRLPLLTGERAAALARAAPTLQPIDDAQQRVLVVDDNIEAAQVLINLMRLEGHEVQVAYDGRSALELARTYVPQVVLLDIGLPGMDGYKVAEGLRGETATKTALIVAVTGYGRDEDMRRAQSAGFDRYLTKPVDLEALRRIVGSTQGERSPA